MPTLPLSTQETQNLCPFRTVSLNADMHIELYIYTHTHIHTHTHTHIHTLHYIALHYISLPYITLHYITLHYITLHYAALHYITLHTLNTLHALHTLHTYIHIYIHNYTQSFYGHFHWETLFSCCSFKFQDPDAWNSPGEFFDLPLQQRQGSSGMKSFKLATQKRLLWPSGCV